MVQNLVRLENCEGDRERDVEMEIIFFKARLVTTIGWEVKRKPFGKGRQWYGRNTGDGIGGRQVMG